MATRSPFCRQWLGAADLTRFAPAAALIAAAALAGCGGSGGSSGKTASVPASGGIRGSTAAPPFVATLQGGGHSPTANKPWPYTVTVRTNAGKPLDGTLMNEFLFTGTVVGKEGVTHKIKNGRFHDTLTFPPAAVGHPLTLRAVVKTHLGTRNLDYPVTVKK